MASEPGRVAWLKPRIKESRIRVKKLLKKRVKKGIKSVKSAPPEAYVAGGSVLVGGAAVVLLATTKSGRELLVRTAQLTGWLEGDEPDSEESDVQEEEQGERAAAADVEDKPQKGTNGDDESRPRKPEAAHPATARSAAASHSQPKSRINVKTRPLSS